MNIDVVSGLLALCRRRAAALALQAGQVSAILAQSPVDLSAVIGPTVLLAQGTAKAALNAVAFAMGDPDFRSQRLELQAALAAHGAVLSRIRAGLGAMAFRERLPNIEAYSRLSPGSRAFGANRAGVSIATSLEQALNAPSVAGVSIGTFWSTTPDARESLGRLLVMDLALTRAYDFDPTVEALSALSGLVPLVPSALSVIRAVEAAHPPGASEPPAEGVRAFQVLQGMDLIAFSAEVLRNPDAWRRIALLNGLRYPYVSDDPVDQLGDPAGVRALRVPAPLGASSVRLVDSSGLYRDQRLRLSEGRLSQVVTLTSVDAATGDVAFAQDALDDGYTPAASVTVYPPAYDVFGKVLVPGDTLLVPVSIAEPAGLVVRGPGVRASEDRLYGADIAVAESGALAVSAGDLATVSGRANYVQALRNRLRTAKGSLPHHPDYGFSLEAFLGFRHEPFFDFFAVVEGRQALLRDPRTDRVDDLSASFSGDTLVLEFAATSKAQEQFPATVGVAMRG